MPSPEEGDVPATRRPEEHGVGEIGSDSNSMPTTAARQARRAAVLGGGLALVLVVCAVVSGGDSRGLRSELSPWDHDPEVAKMQATIDSLSQTLDATKHQIEKAQIRSLEDAAADIDAKKYLQPGAHVLREVYDHPESFNTKLSAMPNVAKKVVHTRAAVVKKPAAKETLHVAPALVSLKIMNNLTAALQELEDSKFTPVHTRKMATSTLSEVVSQLQDLEGEVDCSRKAEYDRMLADFGGLLEQLQRDNAQRAQMDTEKKEIMDKAVTEFSKIEKAYNDSTARLAEAQEHARIAHDSFVKYKTLMEELNKEKADVEKRLSTSGQDSKNTVASVATLKTYINEMQSAIDTGAQDTYTVRLMDATSLVDKLVTSDANKAVLRTGLKSPSKPKEMTAHILHTIEDQASSSASGLEARLTTVQEALTNAEKLYKQYQMDYITFETDVDLQKELQRAAHADLNQLDGRQMGATMAYEAWHKEYQTSLDTNARVSASTEEVIQKLADGLAACTGGAAAAQSKPQALQAAMKAAADKIRGEGKKAIESERMAQEKGRALEAKIVRSAVHTQGKGKTAAGVVVATIVKPVIRSQGRGKDAIQGEMIGKKHARAVEAQVVKPVVHAQQLAGDPVLYKEPEDLNDRSTVEGIEGAAYPPLHPQASENLGGPEIDEYNSAVAEADVEHGLDEPGLGLPKHAQWINSWARKTPGAMVIKPLHLSALDRQILAAKPLTSSSK